jgi:RND family efflux transporter MFP subunit
MTENRFLYRSRAALVGVLGLAMVVFALTRASVSESKPSIATTPLHSDALYTAHDTTISAEFNAGGVAAPIRQATLSTRLMGAVTDVQVREGEHVAAGQILLRIDARDLTAKSSQAAAGVAEATALHNDAVVQANRIRALYADSAATRVQLDAAETGVARTRAGLEAAQAAATELGAVSSYSVIRAPFSGIVTKRFVDPGAFATPGAPLVTIQDVSTLRISATTTPSVAQGLQRGQILSAQVERSRVQAAIEGVVPAAAGNLYTINALVPNATGGLLAGSRASLALPTGARRVLVVPSSAVTRVGDLTGVTLRTEQGDDRRWVRLGVTLGDMVEVTTGLKNGERIVVPNAGVAIGAGR